MAQQEYEESVKEGAKNTKEFYDDFFNGLIVNIGKKMTCREFREMMCVV